MLSTYEHVFPILLDDNYHYVREKKINSPLRIWTSPPNTFPKQKLCPYKTLFTEQRQPTGPDLFFYKPYEALAPSNLTVFTTCHPTSTNSTSATQTLSSWLVTVASVSSQVRNRAIRRKNCYVPHNVSEQIRISQRCCLHSLHTTKPADL